MVMMVVVVQHQELRVEVRQDLTGMETWLTTQMHSALRVLRYAPLSSAACCQSLPPQDGLAAAAGAFVR